MPKEGRWSGLQANALQPGIGKLIPTQNLEFETQPAVGRVTVSSPAVIRPLAKLNEGKAYPEQIKPFNFLLTCHVKAFGCPKGTDPEHFHLIARIMSSIWESHDHN